MGKNVLSCAICYWTVFLYKMDSTAIWQWFFQPCTVSCFYWMFWWIVNHWTTTPAGQKMHGLLPWPAMKDSPPIQQKFSINVSQTLLPVSVSYFYYLFIKSLFELEMIWWTSLRSSWNWHLFVPWTRDFRQNSILYLDTNPLVTRRSILTL